MRTSDNNRILMPNEIEPTFPNGEQGADDSEMLKQEWIVEGLVVATDKTRPQYIVTKVLAGHETVYPGDYRYHELTSPNANFALSPEDFAEYSYRGLVSKNYYRSYTQDKDNLDSLLATDVEVQVGDRVKIVRWSQEVAYEYDRYGGGKGASSRTEYIESATVLESGIDIDEEESRVLKQKSYIQKNFAGILRRLEQLQLQQRERLQTNVDTPIAWDHEGQKDGAIARYVYGEGLIEDHFVTLSAKPHTPDIENPLPGDMRFTQSGRAFLQRDITVGEQSKELALINEPLLELSASVWTNTAFNPEVDNVRVDFIVDAVHYAGSIDIELSTRSFRNPGHHLEFTTFSNIDVEYDGVEIKTDESDAILKYKDTIRKLHFRASQLGIEAKTVQKELGEEISSTDMVSAQSLLEELRIASLEAFRDIQPVLEQINARSSDTKFGGVRLLVPQSKLESVRVLISQTSEANQ
jgi:hypothetical protein